MRPGGSPDRLSGCPELSWEGDPPAVPASGKLSRVLEITLTISMQAGEPVIWAVWLWLLIRLYTAMLDHESDLRHRYSALRSIRSHSAF